METVDDDGSAQLRALAARAIPGPWQVAQYEPDEDEDDDEYYVVDADGNHVCGGLDSDSAAFIVAARSAIPTLLDQIENRSSTD